MHDGKQIAALALPGGDETVAALQARYPARALPEGAMVTRLAPSPTGELHIGTLYAAFLSYRLACQSGGAFYVRLDDTDRRREVAGSRDRIPAQLRQAGIAYAEGYLGQGMQAGDWGPYVQSWRAHIYRAYAKALVAQGKAYPCFCTEEALARMRQAQTAEGAATGCWGKWAVDRDLSAAEVQSRIAQGMPYVIRLRADAAPGRVVVHDLIKGTVSFPANVQDVILLKSDGLPTYHFAHAVDDTLMHTTHVIRGDEWLPSLPIHVQLFEAIGHRPPIYGHIAPIMKKEGGSKRKFSKRLDADGHISYYLRLGVPARAMQEYYMHLLNSAYGDWRMANPALAPEAYAIDMRNFSVSGAVFDMQKLDSIARDMIARMPAGEALAQLTAWAGQYSPALHSAILGDMPYALGVLSVGRGLINPRKDISKWSEAEAVLGYFWDALFRPVSPAGMDADFLRAYAAAYDPGDAKDAWFAALKRAAGAAGYALDKGRYQAAPDSYRGTVADAAAVLRRALCGRDTSPDLYEVMRAMGEGRVRRRLCDAMACPQEGEK